MFFSIIIPVYNRPDEINELLESMIDSDFDQQYEIVIVEDGSTIPCKDSIGKFQRDLNISYFYKENSGPGDSRNYGMKMAKGDYFIIFDSDCIIPKQYLFEVNKELTDKFVDCFGGPDAALDSFSDIQKAINFAMTSFLTTGGIRGGSEKINKFQPRSFNMGISKKAFEISNGFGNIHPGEDPDLSIRLWKFGFETRLFPKAFVYHKRRIDWKKFSVQVNKFGKARPILNSWYPEFGKLTFFFPTLFILGLLLSIFLLLYNTTLPIIGYIFYYLSIFIVSSIQNSSFKIGLLSLIAVSKQFYGYGSGFLESYFKIIILKQNPVIAFPELFFKKNSMTKIIGLTGGIGSGKTMIANYIKSLGIPIYIADEEAKKIMKTSEVLQAIEKEFGNSIFEEGKLNNEKLAQLVFNNPEKLQKLNSIVHPLVKKHFDKWVESNSDFPFLIKEAAILFESGSYKFCDSIITITSPLETRIKRVLERDKTDRESVLDRIRNQWTDEERVSKSDYVVHNTSINQTKRQVDEILKKLNNQ